MNTLNAIRITSHTLVGYFFDEKKGLYPRGNCFSMEAKDGNNYKILNFGVENLNLLLAAEIIEFPIKIHPLSEKHAVIMDERIPDRFYWDKLCSTCTPIELLPIPQRIEKEMQSKRGHVKTLENGIRITTTSLINGIDISGNDYSNVQTEPLNLGTLEQLSENKKIRYQEMIKPFIEANQKMAQS